MEIVDLPLSQLREAPWNANQMNSAMLSRLRQSISRFGLVVPLVVRSIGYGHFETIGGAQRLAVLREIGIDRVPCVVVEADDVQARLLSQCLNRIAGEDDLGLRSELIREVLTHTPESGVLSLLPETSDSLHSLASLGQETMAEYLDAWQKAQPARLRHLTAQLTPHQLDVVEEALARLLPMARESQDRSPNARGTALYLLCLGYLERELNPS